VSKRNPKPDYSTYEKGGWWVCEGLGLRIVGESEEEAVRIWREVSGGAGSPS
jgi:hypothetical protein